jgi:hypothetical protein
MEDKDKLSEEDWRCKGGEVFDFFSFTKSLLSDLVLEGKFALSPLAVAITNDCKEGPMDLRFWRALVRNLDLSEGLSG